jgi:hypothetical protein
MRTIVTIALLVLLLADPGYSGQESASSFDPKIEAEAMRTLDDYMNAWNRMDLAAWELTFHFPHYRLASGKMTVLDGPGKQDAARIRASIGADWHHSKWDRRRIISASPDKVHVDTKFTRYRADNTTIGTFESLYILTKENGRWGVKLRSSYAR